MVALVSRGLERRLGVRPMGSVGVRASIDVVGFVKVAEVGRGGVCGCSCFASCFCDVLVKSFGATAAKSVGKETDENGKSDKPDDCEYACDGTLVVEEPEKSKFVRG